MIRIKPVSENNEKAKELLDIVKKKMGSVPNIFSTMANSPAVLKSYLNFSQALSTGDLPVTLREQIALLVGESNGCEYCVSAHTAIGKGAGLTEQDTHNARIGVSSIQKEQVVYDFVRVVLQNRAHISDADIENLRKAGYSDSEISEIVANIAINIFTNYFNIIAGTKIDFPLVSELNAA
jgi:uncharacterized peroxidase-related enzyme